MVRRSILYASEQELGNFLVFCGYKPIDFGDVGALGLFFLENFMKSSVTSPLRVLVGLVPLDYPSEHFMCVGIGIERFSQFFLGVRPRILKVLGL